MRSLVACETGGGGGAVIDGRATLTSGAGVPSMRSVPGRFVGFLVMTSGLRSRRMLLPVFWASSSIASSQALMKASKFR